MTWRVQQLVQRLGLQGHPEGGWFREVHRDPSVTTIHYVLDAGALSPLHRLRTRTELWHFYGGTPLSLHVIAGGVHSVTTLSHESPVAGVQAGARAGAPAPPKGGAGLPPPGHRRRSASSSPRPASRPASRCRCASPIAIGSSGNRPRRGRRRRPSMAYPRGRRSRVCPSTGGCCAPAIASRS